MTLSSQTPIGKYVVRRLLAEGGMGEVYLCTSRGPEGFEKEVVIKRIRSFFGRDAEFVKMFIAEARLASLLNHPNVVQIFDFDKHEDTYYLAMEYVPGHSLIEVQKRRRELQVPLTSVLIAHIGAEVARGLHYAHGKTDKGEPLNLVHRDCTPHNVLLSYDGAVKLADFGVAKASNQSTAPGSLKGKYAYMSPEQARGESVDARSDIFTLGIVLWELLTGAKLFDEDSDVGTLRAVQQRLIADPSRLHPDVPTDLSAIVMKALERNLSSRYQTAQDLEWELSRFAAVHADSNSARDVGAFLRKLFPEDAHAWGAVKEEPPVPVVETVQAAALPPLSPDEDPNGTTVPRVAIQHAANRTGTPVRRPASASPAVEQPGLGAASATTRLERPAPSAKAPSLTRHPRVPAWLVGALAGVVAIAIAGTAVVRHYRRSTPDPKLVAILTPTTQGPPERPAQLPVVAPPTVAPLSPEAPVAASAESTVKPVDKTEPAHSEAALESKKTPTGEPGFVLVKIKPWAYVFIDNKPQGLIGGPKKIKLSAGTHRLRFENSGHVKDATVHVEPGKTVEQGYNAGL